MNKYFLCGAALVALGSASSEALGVVPSYISLSAGYYNVLDKDKAMDLRAEYRSGKSVVFEYMHPYAGLEITLDGSTWVGGGLLYNYSFSPGWYFTPSLGVGLYSQGGSERNLDWPIQFRTQLEVSYEFENQHRLGVGFSHMSNGSLGDTNPGAEVLAVYWHIPFDYIF